MVSCVRGTMVAHLSTARTSRVTGPTAEQPMTLLVFVGVATAGMVHCSFEPTNGLPFPRSRHPERFCFAPSDRQYRLGLPDGDLATPDGLAEHRGIP